MISTKASHAQELKFEIIEFRQPAFKEHLEKTSNEMIKDSIKAKVRIFVT